MSFQLSTGVLCSRSYSNSFDPHFDKVAFLSHLDGTIGSTNFRVVKGSPLTSNANCRVASSALSPLGVAARFAASETVGGVAPYLSSSNIPIAANEDFTLELSLTPNSLPGVLGVNLLSCYSYTGQDNGWGIQYKQDGKVRFFIANNSVVAVDVTSTTTIPLNQRTVIAITRASGSVRLFLNGIMQASGATSSGVNSANPLLLGTTSATNFNPAVGNPQLSLTGLIDEVRITKGIARYTSTYTPSTLPFPDQ